MSDDMDERYATAREHWELREDVAGLKADMRQIGPQLTRIETMIAAKATQQPPPADTNALALHHLADAVKQIKTPPPQQQGWKNPDMLPWLLFFGLLGAIVGDASGLLSLIG